jgi:hypothetical protein
MLAQKVSPWSQACCRLPAMGATLTHAPGADSDLVDQGSCAGEPYDQRGHAGDVVVPIRAFDDPGISNKDDGCDIGAVELGATQVPVSVDLTVFLEGPYENELMSTQLNTSGALPLTQPYNTAPWNYGGTETVVGPPAKMVDWVLASLFFGGTEDPGGPILISSRALYVEGKGIVSEPLAAEPVFVWPGWYYVGLDHRNHLGVLSAKPVYLKWGETAVYNFVEAGAAYTSGPPPQKDLSGGFFGMFAGDANADGDVQALDFNDFIAQTTSGASGYQSADFNLDGNVQALDFNLYIANTLSGAASQVP